MSSFEQDVAATQRWFDSPRFAGLVRLYTARQVVEQRDHEADVVHARRRRRAAADSRVPGKQPAPNAAAAVGIDRDKALAVGDLVHARVALLLASVRGAAMKVENRRQWLAARHGRGHAHDVTAVELAVDQRELMVSGREGGCARCCPGEKSSRQK